ncbi:MAG: glycogen debranching N-terminal domain-containing protein [Halapricum sp.]
MLADSTVTDGTTFLVTDPDGRFTRDHDGLFHRDMRHLSDFEIRLEERSLESIETHAPRPGRRSVHLSTPLERGSRTLSVCREQALADGLFERIEIENLRSTAVEDTLSLTVETAFLDLFEVRGDCILDREIEATAREDGVSFAYRPDDIEFGRETHVTATDSPSVAIERGEPARAVVTFDISLSPHEARTITLAVTTDEPATDVETSFERATTAVQEREREWDELIETPSASDSTRATVLDQSVADLLALRLKTDYGLVLAAGTPWFSTVFGRDSIIAAYQTLPLSAEPARGTLRYLAAHQATETDEFRDAEPGKIPHEIRHGELAERGEIPHTPYYGTVDATPLWIVLLHETWTRTGDDDLVTDLWETLQAALTWLEEYGDSDGDGFLEYGTDRIEDGGLTHQAWKDSEDGIVHSDGSYPEGPIAPSEVQGYYYDALRRAADLHEEFGDADEAATLREHASDLKAAFDSQFWLDEESFYAVALDGNGEPIDCVATNPGQCLWSGIVPEERADDVVDRLVAADLFSGWGIRTVSAEHDAYNPQSYHLGSVWPHDNSLIAMGMVDYGRREAAEMIAEGLFEAAALRGNDRLPELFAGFDRERTDVPIEYGVACEPQAWAAAAPIACHTALQSLEDEYARTASESQR